MTQADTHKLRISPRSLAADAYEVDSSTGVIEDSLDLIEDLGAYNHWVFDLLKPHVAGRVLEVGCGTGNITKFLASAADEVVGIDPVELKLVPVGRLVREQIVRQCLGHHFFASLETKQALVVAADFAPAQLANYPAARR